MRTCPSAGAAAPPAPRAARDASVHLSAPHGASLGARARATRRTQVPTGASCHAATARHRWARAAAAAARGGGTARRPADAPLATDCAAAAAARRRRARGPAAEGGDLAAGAARVMGMAGAGGRATVRLNITISHMKFLGRAPLSCARTTSRRPHLRPIPTRMGSSALLRAPRALFGRGNRRNAARSTRRGASAAPRRPGRVYVQDAGDALYARGARAPEWDDTSQGPRLKAPERHRCGQEREWDDTSQGPRLKAPERHRCGQERRGGMKT